jgi:CRP/FNR family transcriptional regulator, anaerobic regulatory protein
MLMPHKPLYLRDDSHPQALACAACEVRRSALFGALDTAALERVHVHIAAPLVAPGDRVYARGAAGGAVFTIRAGIVRFERITPGGTRRIVRLAGRGDLIGTEALLKQPYRDDAVACTEVQLCRIPQTLVDDLGGAQVGLHRELMARWQQALDEAAAWSADLSTGAARLRMLKMLVLLCRHRDDDGLIWLPRRDEIGDMLDMTFETASRQVSRLRREGILESLPPRGARVDAGRLTAALAAAEL